jgi:hypothetical protein
MQIGLGAIGVLDAEQGHPDANIRSFADPLWSAYQSIASPRQYAACAGATARTASGSSFMYANRIALSRSLK